MTGAHCLIKKLTVEIYIMTAAAHTRLRSCHYCGAPLVSFVYPRGRSIIVFVMLRQDEGGVVSDVALRPATR